MPVCSSSKEEIRASCLPRRIWHHSATRAQRLRRAGCMTPQKLVASLPIMFLILCSPSPASAAHRQAHRRPFRNHGVQQEKLLLPEEGEAQGLAGARRGVTAQARAIRGTRRGSAAAGWDSIAAEECPGRPYVNETWLMSEESLEVGIHDCRSFTDVCLDQSAYILYSPEYRPTTQSFPELPKLDISTLLTQWRGGSGESTNIMGDFRNYPEIVFRPPLFGDEKNPTFSNCTLPIVLYKSHEDNFYHLTVSLIPQLYSFLTEHMVNTDVTYVLATLQGLAVPPFLKEFMMPFTRYEVQSLADFSSRLPRSFRSKATAEGLHVRCFQKVVACHIKDISHYDTGVRDLGAAPKYVYQWFKDRKLVPRDPAGFGARTRVTEKNEDAEVPMLPIRVLIVDRNDTRKIVNHEELVQQCQEDPGPWDCRGYSFGSGFIKDVEAVQSADVLVAAHGAGNANFIFMRDNTSFLEIIPYEFTRYSDGHWLSIYNPTTVEKIGYRVRYYGLNVEDPELSVASPYEEEGWSLPWPASRDRYMKLPWAVLKQMLELFQRATTVEEYVRMIRDGDNIFDILPGNTLRRTPVPNEMFGTVTAEFGNFTGQEALDLLDGGLNVLQQGNASEAAAAEEALRAALGRARAAEERTANAVEVLETRIADGRKTNHTVVELVREQRVINAGILHTVSSAINETRLSFLLTEHA